MATAIRQLGQKPTMATKAYEIQTIIHQQIINLGEDVYRKSTERQQELFDEYLSKREKKLLCKLEDKKVEALKTLHQQHSQEIEQLKNDYAELQNEAVKVEVKRVEKIMNNVAAELVERTQLEGQKKLESTLIEAKVRFDREKDECVKDAIRMVQSDFDALAHKERICHKESVDELKRNLKIKIQEYGEEQSKLLSERLESQREELEKSHAENLQKSLMDLQVKHDSEIKDCHDDIKQLEIKNKKLSRNIERLNQDLNSMKTSMRSFLGMFREFAETCSGFEEGQTDFLLHNLIPKNVEHFLRD